MTHGRNADYVVSDLFKKHQLCKTVQNGDIGDYESDNWNIYSSTDSKE